MSRIRTSRSAGRGGPPGWRAAAAGKKAKRVVSPPTRAGGEACLPQVQGPNNPLFKRGQHAIIGGEEVILTGTTSRGYEVLDVAAKSLVTGKWLDVKDPAKVCVIKRYTAPDKDYNIDLAAAQRKAGLPVVPEDPPEWRKKWDRDHGQYMKDLMRSAKEKAKPAKKVKPSRTGIDASVCDHIGDAVRKALCLKNLAKGRVLKPG
ncbi:MAG: hypothetical protein WC729_29610 [Sphingomonas sp.]|uniref:hypothetical protein n=1 Tax=Sphingomonas sp. TaxID=28214 RepID=UPI003566CA85